MRPLLSGVRRGVLLAVCAGMFCACAQAESKSLEETLRLARHQAEVFLEQFSEVKCTEKVTQEKLNQDGKVERNAESTYDYLVILTNLGGELSLNESRLALHEAKPDRQKTSLLVSNGFATLFLVFHPYYAGSFEFTAQDDGALNGHRMRTVAFEHIRGTRSPAALSLRGRDYPLELSGRAWIDPQSGWIAKIVTTIGSSMQDVGLKTMDSEVDYAPLPALHAPELYWFPVKATVEVETPRQHWRNTHVFSDYKMFSVSTEEKVANGK
ncbi:MAG TPA: hypothetical protein VGJ21_07795 [Terracidiphilus sp.]